METGNESHSQPKQLDHDDKSLDTVTELTNPQSNNNTSPKPQPQNKPSGLRVELPISLPVLPSCDKSKRNDYEATYNQSVEQENTYHDSEVNRILGLELLDELLTEALDSETIRHQDVLSNLKANLEKSLSAIACS